jgi:hypothetical protein
MHLEVLGLFLMLDFGATSDSSDRSSVGSDQADSLDRVKRYVVSFGRRRKSSD